jgi:hypothetical protein
MDLRAVAEIAGFGYAFGHGTPYADIRVLRPCEVVQVSCNSIKLCRYFQWDSIRCSDEPEQYLLREAYDRFIAAVRRRLRGDRTTFAYLSGGLDSRCTVSALRTLDTHLYTFNFSLAGTQDQVFGLDFANKAGTVHHEIPTEPGPDWSMVMSQSWAGRSSQITRRPEHPSLVWTGEGGSVGLGHVYLSPAIVRFLRAGDMDGAIKLFLQEHKRVILQRLLKPDVAAALAGHLQKQWRSELDQITHPDPVRRLSIFFNLNGPRRHLVRHFETIDQHRLEFQVPFYDSHFLEFLTAIPLDLCLYHKFYVKWLSFFDGSVLAVPWQSYPGHVPSFAPVPEHLPDQWQAPASARHRKIQRRDLLRRIQQILKSADFPDLLLRREYLKVAKWLCEFRLKDYSYALQTAETYCKYWEACKGKYKF